MQSVIEVIDIQKNFLVGSQEVSVLRGASLQIPMGDFALIVGPSGCGKSTLLHIILGLEEPNSGDVVFLGEHIYKGTDEDYRSSFRKKHIGMIYQQPNWVKSMNVLENVAFPLMLLGMDKVTSQEKALGLLQQIKMEQWAQYRPTELSGGQQQRIALARALSNNPEIIIADEPTGNLDFQSGQEVMELLRKLNQEQGKTVVMVTHDLEYLKFAQTAIRMFDGKVLDVFHGDQIAEFAKDLHFKRGAESSSSSTTESSSPDVSNVVGASPLPSAGSFSKRLPVVKSV